MNRTLNEQSLLRRTRLTVLICVLALNTVFALVLAPLYSSNNIVVNFDYMKDILELLMLILHLSSFFLAYAVTTYSIFRFSLKETVPTIIIFSLLTAYKYGLNLVAGWFIYDSIPTASSEIRLSIMSTASNTVLELLQYAIIILIITTVIGRAMPAIMLRKKQMEKINGEAFPIREGVFPFKKIYSSSNPLQRSALFSAVAVIILRVGQFIIYDIFIGGVPESLTDAMWMIAYYAGTFALGALGYLFMLLTMMRLDKYDIK